MDSTIYFEVLVLIDILLGGVLSDLGTPRHWRR
jgi:hypothetical protein